MNRPVDALTQEEAEAILKIKDGVDVYSHALAGVLRGMQRRGVPVGDLKGPKRAWRRPRGRLFLITEPQAYAGDGTDQVPYFGAIATSAGIDAARAALELAR
jgi:hypothetical protein